ncbi:MAG TPA: hypothetical protein VGJ84_07540 [Polyangiaceae bacterium]
MTRSPLDEPRARAVYEHLEAGDLPEARRLLSALGDDPSSQAAIGYLSTRVLFLRGRLQPPDVAERMQLLISEVPDFPEAKALLRAAREGTLEAAQLEPESRPNPVPSDVESVLRHATTPSIEISNSEPLEPPNGPRFSDTSPMIPRPPALPVFTPPPDPRPSYVPEPEPSTVREPWAARQDKVDKPVIVPREEPSDPAPTSRAADLVSFPRHPQTDKPPPRRPSAEPRVRSARPPSVDPEAATNLFKVTALLGQGHFEQALGALDSLKSNTTPPLLLLRGRALLGAGRRDEARSVVSRLAGAPLLEPEVRAGCARLMVELGELVRALEQAERACEDDPSCPAAEHALLWALVRRAWQTQDATLLERARKLLPIRETLSMTPASVDALCACVEALSGKAERAVQLGKKALESAPDSLDALAAVAIGASRRGSVDEAERAVQRLSELDPRAAASLELRLELKHPGKRPWKR